MERYFEKAYDRVDWLYRDAVLKEMGFPLSFIAIIQALYTKASARLVINGKLSDRIIPTRGVRQGRPLSPFLLLSSLNLLAY